MRWSPGPWEWPGLQSLFLDGVSAAVVESSAPRRWLTADAQGLVQGRGLLPRGPREDTASSKRGLLQHEALGRGRRAGTRPTARRLADGSRSSSRAMPRVLSSRQSSAAQDLAPPN